MVYHLYTCDFLDHSTIKAGPGELGNVGWVTDCCVMFKHSLKIKTIDTKNKIPLFMWITTGIVVYLISYPVWYLYTCNFPKFSGSIMVNLLHSTASPQSCMKILPSMSVYVFCVSGIGTGWHASVRVLCVRYRYRLTCQCTCFVCQVSVQAGPRTSPTTTLARLLPTSSASWTEKNQSTW